MSVLSHILLDQTRGHLQKLHAARYVNDVHLPRFGRGRDDTFGQTDFVIPPATLYGTRHPQPDAPRAIQRMSPPRTAGMIAQTAAARQWPRQPKLAHDVRHSAPKRKFRTAFANTARNLRKYVNSQTNSLPCRRSADDIAVRTDGDFIW